MQVNTLDLMDNCTMGIMSCSRIVFRNVDFAARHRPRNVLN
jgi:hypothetical protein